MAHLPKLGQFGYTVKRSQTIVRSVEERWHRPGEGPEKLWKYLSFFVGAPAILLAMTNCYLRHGEHEGRPEPLPYPHLKIINKPFPWGDGKHTLFHNPKTNYIPGIGYEE